MILVFGGAYQGKIDFACRRFSLSDSDIFRCNDLTIDFNFRCVSDLEQFSLKAVRAGKCPSELLKLQKSRWTNTVFVCRDISSGVVPMDAEMRKWRDENGRLCQYLAQEAEQVYRVFCGLGQRLK